MSFRKLHASDRTETGPVHHVCDRGGRSNDGGSLRSRARGRPSWCPPSTWRPVLQPPDTLPIQRSLNRTKACRGGCVACPQELSRGPQSQKSCPAPGPPLQDREPGLSCRLIGGPECGGLSCRLVGGPECGLRLRNSASISERRALCHKQQGAWGREEAASRQICFQIKCYFFPLELSVELTLLLKNHQISPCLDTDTFPSSPPLSLSQP